MSRNMYLDKAAEAVRELYAAEHEPTDHTNAEHDAVRAVTDAVTATRFTITHRQIASLAGVSGLLVARLIDNAAARAEALRSERHAAERYVTEVRDAIRGEAVRRIEAGDRKLATAESLGITRPTLDAWLSSEES